MSAAKVTVDHEEIRRWVEARGGCPSHVKRTGKGKDPGILRIDFPGFSGQTSLESISWDAFFETFEDNELAFLYQDDKNSRFNKLVSRDSVDITKDEQAPASRSRLRKASAQKEPQQTKSGAARAVNAISLLEQQHRQVEALFHEYEQSEDADEKLALFEEIADKLAAHSKIEETIFYPALYADETEDALREAVEEHLAAKRVIADLLAMNASDEQFDAKMAVLKEQVLHHVEEEEEQLFAFGEKSGSDHMAELGSQMKSLFDQLIQEEPRREVPSETQRAARLG